jgi:hypothetical protein
MKFQWLGDATDRNRNYLRNCGLLLACEGQSHLTALSQAEKAQPLVFDLAKGTAEIRLSRDYLPDPSQLRLKVLVDDKQFPPHVLKAEEARGREPRSKGPKAKGNPADNAPGDTVAARGTVSVVLTKQDAPPSALRVRFEPNPSTVLIRLTAWAVAGVGALNERGLRELELKVPAMEQAAQAYKSLPKKPPGGRDVDKEVREFKEHVAALGTLAGEINHKRIDFQVFLPLTKPGENTQHDLVLFQSAEPKAEPKKK